MLKSIKANGGYVNLYIIAFSIPLILFFFFCFLWINGNHGVYTRVLNGVGVPVGWPAYQPFVDFRNPLQWLYCYNRGVDVLHVNTCSAIMNYSPIWLIFSKIIPNSFNFGFFGVAIDIVIAGMIILMLRPKTLSSSAFYMIILSSPITVLSFERLNIDLILFGVTIGACFLFELNRRTKIASYLLIYSSALIKFYPVMAMGLAVTSKPKRFLVVSAVTLLATAGFAAIYHHDLRLVFSNLPYSNPLREVYGGGNLFAIAGDLAARLVPVEPAFLAMARSAVYLLAGLSVFIGSFLWAQRLATPQDEPLPLGKDETLFLAGGLIVVGTFFAGQNAPYRAIWLLMLLPYLMTLQRNAGRAATRQLASVLLLLIATLMWFPFFRTVLDLSSGDERYGDLLALIVREPSWWTLIAGLTTLIWMQLDRTPTALSIRRRLASRPQLAPVK